MKVNPLVSTQYSVESCTDCVVRASDEDATQRLHISDVLPFTVTSGGVTLHIDHEEEDCWIEAAIDHDPLALLGLLGQLPARGLELLPEDEAMPTINPDGSVRMYLVEVYDNWQSR